MADIQYGGSGAGFADTIARMRAEAAAIAELNAKEAERAAADERSTVATQGNARARAQTAQTANALVDVVGRSVEVTNAETAAVQANTAAWVANAAARGRAIGAAEVGGVALPRDAAAGTTAAAYGPGGVPLWRQPVARAGATGGTAARAEASLAAGDLATVAQRNNAALAEQAARQAAVNDVARQSAAAYAASSQALQRHGALTSEFIQGLVRGEVTLKEFESQMVITLGKFGGWAVAGGLVYGAYDAVKNIFQGITETQSGVEQLRRSLGEKVDESQAVSGFRRVAIETNTSIREVADAQFYAARAFKNQEESLEVARTALLAYKLDQVNTQEAIKSFGAVSAIFGTNAAGIKTLFDELDVGQLKFNARLQQTLPQVGRAAASFANAGGTPEQLAQQIIELNRATGGGGGQGGGNPATFLIREPGNLAKITTEDTLRRFGFDPKFAQQNVGAFNEAVQAKAAKGELSREALGQLAVAVGGGTANGLRYGLPLFLAGESGLAARVQREVNPRVAGGSAEEDLRHKVGQFDEQVHKIGVTLQTIGSSLGSIGVGVFLLDFVHGLNLLVSVLGLVLGPVAAVGEAFSDLPAPLREMLELSLALKGAQLFARSGPGLAAQGFANQAGLSFLGGGARELTAVVATQRSFVSFLRDEQEKLASQSLVGSSRARVASAQVSAFVRPEAELAGLSAEERAAYEAQLSNLIKAEVDTAAKQEAAAQAQLEQRAILVNAERELALLTNKRLSVEERLTAASASGLYAAQLGSPNTKPFLAPVPGVAGAAQGEEERVAAYGPGGVPLWRQGAPGAAGAVPTISGVAAEETGAAAASVEAEAVAGGSLLAGVGAKLGAAGAAVKTLPGLLSGVAGSLKGFIAGLGPLGLAIAGFFVVDELSKLTGGTKEFQKGLGTLSALESEISSESDAIRKITLARTAAKKTESVGGEVGGLFHDLVASVEHPQQAVESIFDEGAHPGTFIYAQRAREKKEADALEKRRKEGKFKGLGTAANVPGQALVEYGNELEAELAGLSTGQTPQNSEKAAATITKRLKLLFDRVKLFGTGGANAQAFQKLQTFYGTLAGKATSSQDENLLDEFARVGDEANKGIEEQVVREVKQGLRLAKSTQDRAAILQNAKQKLGDAYKSEISQPLAKAEEEFTALHEAITTVDKQLGAKQGDTSALRKRQQTLQSEYEKQKLGLEQLRSAGSTLAKEQTERIEDLGKETYQGDVGEIKAQGALAQAKAGGNKQKQVQSQLKEVRKELESAEANLTGNERTKTVDELNAQIIKAEQSLVTNHLSLIKAVGQRHIAEVPLQQPVQTAHAELKAAEDQARYIEAHKHDFSLEEVLEAGTAVLKAKKALEEATRKNAEAISQLNTQIQQAESHGDAVAQANEAIAGANTQLRLAVGTQERLQAQLALINAHNQLLQALQEHVKAEGEVAKSLTTDPVKSAKIEVSTDKRLLALAKGPDERLKAEADLNNAKKNLTSVIVSTRESEINFHQEMMQISVQQAIQQYEQLLKLHHLSKQTRDDLLLKIRQLEVGSQDNKVFDLAPGNIKLPTVYDVHRALEAAGRKGGPVPVEKHGGILHQHNTINVVVNGKEDVPLVAEALDKVTHAGLHARLRKIGLSS